MGETREHGERDATIEPISVVMPVLNEEMYLAQSVEHILSQDYPGELELVLALGPSRDNTTEIARRIAAEDPRVTVVDNPSGKISSAINTAVKAARHAVIARVDGHALIPPGYLALAMATLSRTGAVNVGGVMAAEGETPFQRAVAYAMTSPYGVGASRFHTGGRAGPADTVYLGVFRRTAIEQVGGYDEEYLRAEDWEMNHRIRQSGGMIWFEPELRVTYRPRATAVRLGAQYFQYGRWRRVIARQHAGTINLRYLAPPAAAAAVGAGSLAARRHRRAGRPPGLRRLRAGRVGARRPLPAAARGGAPAPGPGHHAHGLGRRLPDQFPPPGPGPVARRPARRPPHPGPGPVTRQPRISRRQRGPARQPRDPRRSPSAGARPPRGPPAQPHQRPLSPPAPPISRSSVDVPLGTSTGTQRDIHSVSA